MDPCWLWAFCFFLGIHASKLKTTVTQGQHSVSGGWVFAHQQRVRQCLECEINMSIRRCLILQPDACKTSTQGASWQTQHIYYLFRKKKNHSPNPLLTLSKKLFDWVVILPKAFFLPLRTQKRADSEGSAVLPNTPCLSSLFVCAWRESQRQNVNDAGKPPDSLETGCGWCAPRAVDARNLPADSAGQRTFPPVGGIIPTAAESAGRRVFSGGLG